MSEVLTHHGVLGMKWGVRRYQNKDGTLTDAGKRRHERDIRENAARKKENRIDVSEPDPKRYAKEDLTRAKNVVDSGSKLVRQAKQIESESASKSKNRLDLSDLSDKELRDRINRENLERQYNDLFNDGPSISRGRSFVRTVLSNGDVILASTSSALAIALAMKELRG